MVFNLLQPAECKNVPVYTDLNKYIFEYLELNGLEKSLESFTEECKAKVLPCPPLNTKPEVKSAFSHYDAETLMNSFDEGDLGNFLRLWKTFLTHIQVTSDDMKKLEVYIRVHFAIWPRAHGEPEEIQHHAMNNLKLFFEENSTSLSGDPAILPLFALPFVADPIDHPVFKDLFQDHWRTKLRSQLESTMHKYFELLQENICLHSRLAELVVKGEKYEAKKKSGDTDFLDKGNSALGSYHQDRFYQLLSYHRKIRKLLQGTRESYAKLLMMSSELMTAVEQSASAEGSIDVDQVVEKCFYIFPEVFISKDKDTYEGKPDLEHFKRLALAANFDPTQDSDVSLFFLGISDISPDSLDYSKLKDVLTNETEAIGEKLCVMQALRWMITKTNEKCRQYAIDAFVANDLLGLCSKKSEYRHKLFKCLLSTTPTYQKECISRLINAFSSTRSGRNYLAASTFVVDMLIKSLATFKGANESFICQMVIASLQKLSLKKNMRLYMIEHKVINWLISYIKSELVNEEKSGSSNKNLESVRFNPYLMEYGWALLMNLCLHEEAWESCVASGTDILTCAINMLITVPRKDLAPYVVSTLYSLLRSPEMFALAKSMKIENAFAPLLAVESEVSQHLNHLVTLLYSKGCDRITSSRETNYDDDENPDPDVFEPELELPESWSNSLDESDLTGDDLLLRKYMVQIQEPIVPTPAPKSADPTNGGVIIRPVTPSKLPGSGSAAPTTTTEKVTSTTSKLRKSSQGTTTSAGTSANASGREMKLKTKVGSKIAATTASPTGSRTNTKTKIPLGTKGSKNGVNTTLTTSNSGIPSPPKGNKKLSELKKKVEEESIKECGTFYSDFFGVNNNSNNNSSNKYHTQKGLKTGAAGENSPGTMDPGLPITFD